MAWIVGNPMGELRGKLGPNIFSRNGHGQYVRNYILPVNPNTIAQATARNSFSNIVNTYKDLTSAQRTAWKNYADTLYQPRSHSHSMQYSGYQAYIALNMANARSNNLNRNYTIKVDGLAPPYPLIKYDWDIGVSDPPLVSKTNEIIGLSNSFYPTTLESINIKTNAKCNFSLSVPNMGGTTAFSGWVDSNNNKCGYVLYMSNTLKGENYYVRNPLYMCLGFFKAWSWNHPGPPYVVFNNLFYFADDAFDLGKYKSFPTLGKWVQATLYSIDLSGQLKKVGSKRVQIEAP